jgi:carboxyl-terminal processing protease
MNRILSWLVLALATAAQAATLDAGLRPPELKPVPQEAQAAHLAAEVLAHHHYKSMPLDATLSGKIFDQYLKSLDGEKVYFVQSDIDRLSADRTRLGAAIMNEDLTVPFAIFNLFEQRAAERFTYARGLLKKGFDFQQAESYQYLRDKEAWPRSEDEARELWRKRVKNDWLRLRLAGKDDASIVAVLDKRYENFQKRIGKAKGEDAFQSFMNAYTMAIDPHTNYMGPQAAENFDIAMKLSLVGIGAVLTTSDEYTTIRELVPGGPASLSGQLKVGDRIVGVAQGANGPMTDVLGWRLDDTVALIRGKADSVVVLDVLPAEAGPDGAHKVVSMVRKTISLEEQAAKSSVRTITDDKGTHRVGVISLPSFYEDFAAKQRGAPEYRSATRDVARLLDGLKKDKVDSVLIDLRNNGGGSLAEAIELTGLFIGKGPVVQQRNAKGEVTVSSDTHAGVAWKGPLAVLINRGSASASEIFAAAIQDYGRGLIVGQPSFGKGTVQSMVDLDRIAQNGKPQFGELKMTVAQFFRVNGGTTQLRGVTPDIPLLPAADAETFGESTFDNALPWTQIRPADYTPAGDLKDLVPILTTLHEARVKQDKGFQCLQDSIATARALREKNRISLNEAERRKEREAQEAQAAACETPAAQSAGNESADDGRPAAKAAALRDDGLQPEERNLASALAAEKAQKNAKDVVLDEAVAILGDAVAVLKADGRLTASVKPGTVLVPE